MPSETQVSENNRELSGGHRGRYPADNDVDVLESCLRSNSVHCPAGHRQLQLALLSALPKLASTLCWSASHVTTEFERIPRSTYMVKHHHNQFIGKIYGGRIQCSYWRGSRRFAGASRTASVPIPRCRAPCRPCLGPGGDVFFRGVLCNLASVMSPCRCGFRRTLLSLLLFLLVVGTWRARSASLVRLDRLMVTGSHGGYSVRGIRYDLGVSGSKNIEHAK